MGGRVRVEWGGKNISSVLPPEGPRYVEAAGRREQVHGNSEIIAYACYSRLTQQAVACGKITPKRDTKQRI